MVASECCVFVVGGLTSSKSELLVDVDVNVYRLFFLSKYKKKKKKMKEQTKQKKY